MGPLLCHVVQALLLVVTVFNPTSTVVAGQNREWRVLGVKLVGQVWKLTSHFY